MSKPFEPVADRFWSRVVRGEDCWEYTGHRNPDGYGCISRGGRRNGRRGHDVLAHRLSWEMHNGPVPSGLCVLHTCDNPPCVNPDHLWLGTNQDNSRDRSAKGRTRNRVFKGMPRATWSADTVHMARVLKAEAGLGSRRISHVIGVPESTVRKWLSGTSR